MNAANLVLTSRGGISAVDVSEVAGLDLAGPLRHAGYAREFSLREQLGQRGTRNLDRTTGLAIAATGLALAGRAIPDSVPRSELGLVLGSSVGSLRSVVEFTREGLAAARPYLVNPAEFPNTVMNCAAGQAAIWHRLEGINVTISGGLASGFSALEYASIMLARGHAKYLLVGAVEELCPQTAWSHARQLEPAHASHDPIGEGCAMFMLESAATARADQVTILAHIRALKLRTIAGDPLAATTACIHDALAAARLLPDEVWAWSEAGVGRGRLPEVEERAVEAALAGRLPERRVRVAEQIGDTLSASAAMQVASLLSVLGSAPAGSVRHGICTSVLADGTSACLVLSSGC